jgi:hypothetical protein
MLTPVKLDYELRGVRDEIANEGPDRHLLIEANAFQLAVAEISPELALGPRGALAQFTRANCREPFVGFVQQALPWPLPLGREGIVMPTPGPSRKREGRNCSESSPGEEITPPAAD